MHEEKARQLFDALVAIPAAKTPESRDDAPFRPMLDVQLDAGTSTKSAMNTTRIWSITVTVSAKPLGTNWRHVFSVVGQVDEEFEGLTQIAVVGDSIVLT